MNTLGYGSTTTLLDRPVLTVNVESGPDRGKTVRFDQPRVSVGRDARNDFILRDTFVSSSHGEFFRSEEGFVYQDLGSLHGTVVVSARNNPGGLQKSKIQDPLCIEKEGTIQVGASVLRIKIDRVYRSEKESGASRIKVTSDDPSEFMAAQKPGIALTKTITGEEIRMQILFELAGRLNGISHLDKILELIFKAAFEAFQTANLFSISLMKGSALRPIMVRVRGLDTDQTTEVIMSHSVLHRVLETEEAVLYVGGETSPEPSQSMVEASISSVMCAPLMGRNALLGVMQLDTRRSGRRFSRADLDLFCVLASHAAFALERSNLVDDIYRMFEGFVQASVSAIEARDPSTAGHSERVAKYSLTLAETVNRIEVDVFADLHFSPKELTELRYAALLHDFGKVGVREAVLKKATRLNVEQMGIIAQRFKRIQAAFKQKMSEELIRAAIKTGAVIREEQWRLVEEKATHFTRDLDREFRFLEEVRGKWRLEPKEIKRVNAFAKQVFLSFDGQEIPFLDPEELENLTISSGTLTESEWEDMRSHVAKSEAYLRQIPWSEDLVDIPCIAGNHHEKLDGSGYPRGLKAEEISPRVRILTIADIFDAATAWDRPYSIPLSAERAAQLLQTRADEGQLDRELVTLFNQKVLPNVLHLIPDQAQ